MELKPNAEPWVDRNLSRFWQAMEAGVPDDSWLPHTIGRRTHGGTTKVVVEELGCGHYGCVMPTNAEDTVLKLTSDVAEAAFVRAAMELSEKQKGSTSKWKHGYWPNGIVRYKAIYQLADVTYRKRPLFLIWRQEAFEVGFLTSSQLQLRGRVRDAVYRESVEAQNLIQNAQAAAAFVRDWVKKKGVAAYPCLKADSSTMQWAFNYARENWEVIDRELGAPWHQMGQPDVIDVIRRHRGKDRAAVALSFYAMIVEMMRHNSVVVSTVGMAMDYYLDEGIVLADVHLNNIGKIQEPDYDGLVTAITDPGHAVFLDDRYDKLDIEVITPDQKRVAEPA